jgi:hypothetical protein
MKEIFQDPELFSESFEFEEEDLQLNFENLNLDHEGDRVLCRVGL